MAAYQGSYEYFWQDGLRPVLKEDGQPLLVVGLPELDTASGTLTWLSKARGIGDCGDYFVYLLEGDRFQLQEHRSRGCESPEDDVPPTEWSLVGGGDAASAGHCTAAESVYFSCPTSGTKVLSLCGSADRVQYRFGPLGAPELSFPADSSPRAFTVGEERYVRSMANVAAFTSGGVRYEVTDAIGGGGGSDAAANNFQGVYVFEGDQQLAAISCVTEPTRDWGALRAAVSQSP
jgi:hypothetical protein